MTHKEDVPDSLHGGNTSNDKRTTDLVNRQGTDGEDTIEDSDSEVEDCKEDDSIQELPIRESEVEETKESESYKTEDKIVHKSQELSSALKEGRELPPLSENVTESGVQTEEEQLNAETSTTSNDSEMEELPEGKMVTKDNEEETPSSSNGESDNNVTGSEDSDEDITTEWQRRPPDKQKELYNKVQDRRGERPPYSDENNHSNPDNMPHVTRRFIEHWNRQRA